MPERAPRYNSFKALAEEIGHKPSPKDWVQYGIPEGTPWKQALLIRLYRAIIEEKAYHLLPKLIEYLEPATKQIDVNVTDWRQQIDQMGVPIEIVTERLKELMTQVANDRFLPKAINAQTHDNESTIDGTFTPVVSVGESRNSEFDSRRQPLDADCDAGDSAGQEGGTPSLETNREAEDAGRDTCI